MQIVEVKGARVTYRVDGQGPGLVLVHGTGADSQSNWEHLLEQLVPHWKVVRPDYSGSGHTEDDGSALTVPMLGEQVVAAAKAAGAAPFDLVGYSLGAAIAVYIAAEYPELVRSVVLLAGAVSGEDRRLRLQFELWRDLIETDRRALARMVLLTGFSPDFLGGWSQQQVDDTIELILATNRWDGMARQVELDLILDIREWVGRVASPTLVIGCTHDHMVPSAHARELADAIEGACYQEMATGHLAPLEDPDEFVRILKSFLHGSGR
jgi:pimeloyl-ACP methyl ester carboxylesterase